MLKYYIETLLGFIGAMAFNIFCVACVYFMFKGLLL
jgi:cbb3-type cytochrome oxidase subunit 3